MKNHSRHFVAATCALAAFSPVEMMAQKQLLFNTLYIILFYKFSLAALHPIKN